MTTAQNTCPEFRPLVNSGGYRGTYCAICGCTEDKHLTEPGEKDKQTINEMAKTPPAAETPTEPAVIRYEHLDKSDPDYKKKMRAQLDQFEQDAKSGKVLCLSDLMISAGM